ncbi:hypothetical protein C8R43DRAFT_1109638 [Mycena crocata]|nr:hypothetical protein C8R43DRAFT_1109638 [Mycena crocata]
MAAIVRAGTREATIGFITTMLLKKLDGGTTKTDGVGIERRSWENYAQRGRDDSTSGVNKLGKCHNIVDKTPVPAEERELWKKSASSEEVYEVVERKWTSNMGRFKKGVRHKRVASRSRVYRHIDIPARVSKKPNLVSTIVVDEGSIFSAIGRGINAIISAIAGVIMTIVGAITTVIVTIFDVIVDILCCRCFGSRRSGGRRARRRGGVGGAGTTRY